MPKPFGSLVRGEREKNVLYFFQFNKDNSSLNRDEGKDKAVGRGWNSLGFADRNLTVKMRHIQV
jgi:hypothetical protein